MPLHVPHNYALLRRLVFEKNVFFVKLITFPTALETKNEIKPIADLKNASKINMKSRSTVFQVLLCQQLFAFK